MRRAVARRPSDAANAFAPWFACCRRRPITIPASGAARIICWIRESRRRRRLRFDRVERLGQAPGAFFACRVSGWQHASTTRLLALPAAMRNLPAPLRLSEDDAVMLAAMVAGDRTYLTHALRVGFERTGSFHMLVVSGFHLAIVAGVHLLDHAAAAPAARAGDAAHHRWRRLPTRSSRDSPRRCSARCGW